MLNRFTLALALTAALGGQALAYSPPRPGSEILPQLPADAPPGDCYARVRVPGEPAGPPPMTMGAQWVLNPGPAGSPGPIWCLVPTGPVPAQAPASSVERHGWIRVLCDDDATPERIRGVQHRLHQRGYYRGSISGRYDATTAAAVAQFQSQAHIAHGGYLSLQTLQALDSVQQSYGQGVEFPLGPGGYPAGYPNTYGGAYSAYGYEQSGGYARSGSYGYGYAYPATPPVAYAPQPGPCCQMAYAPPPCCAQHGYYGQSYGYSYGYGGGPVPAYAAGRSAIQNGWLTWQGKTGF